MEKKFPIFKILTLLVWLVLGMGTAFALDCVDDTGWGDFEIKSVTPNDTGAYEIDTPEKLAWFSCKVEHDNANFKNAIAILTKSIDMQGKLFIPIAAGTGTPAYAGTFDGQGFTISNLYIDGSAINNNAVSEVTGKPKNGAQAYAQNIGLVGVLSGTIQNLTLKDAQIYAASSAGSTGMAEPKPISVGTFVGWAGEGNPKIMNCVASGTIVTSGATNRVGGIVGNVKNVTISNCVSSVNIAASGEDTHVGGIVGALRNDGAISITSCVYSGTSLHTVDGSVGAIAGNYEKVKKITTEDLFYSDEFCKEFENESDCKGVGVLPSGKKFNTEEKDTLNSESVVCELNGGTWSNEACTGNSSGVWSVGQIDVSLNGSDGFKVTFDANGGVFPEGAKTFKFFAKGATISTNEIENPTYTGNKFAGWSLTQGGEVEDLGTADKAKTIYAVWKPIHTITFKTVPGTFVGGSSEESKNVAEGDVVTVEGLPALPVRFCSQETNGNCDKYAYFNGWSTVSHAPYGEKETIPEGTIVDLPTFEFSDDVTLYAVWIESETYTVTFNANQHGQTKVAFVKVGKNEKTVQPPDPDANEGYVFTGRWCEEIPCDDDTKFNFETEIGRNYVLYADWDVPDYNVTYIINGKPNTTTGNPATYNVEDATITLKKPENAGDKFKGWYDEDGNEATTILSGSTGNKIFYASWKYTITYLADNTLSATTPSDEKEHGVAKELKGATFVHGGCTQDGWSKVSYGKEGYYKDFAVNGSYEDNKDVILYPHWNCNAYEITYDITGAEGLVVNHADNPAEYVGPAKLTLKNAYDSQDRIFMDDWYLENTYKTTIRFVQDIDAPFTVYAKWYNKITYNPGSRLKAVNSNLGSTTDKKYLNKDYTIKSSIKDFVLEKYTLDGWSLSDGGEKAYNFNVKYTANENLTLYPHWVEKRDSVQYGAVKIYTYATDGRKEAVIDGNYSHKTKPNEQRDAVAIPENIQVNSVVMSRTFPENVYSTIVLPFSVNTENVSGLNAVLYYNGIKTENNKSTIRMKVLWAADGVIKDKDGNDVYYQHTDMLANTPYMLLMNDETFAIKSEAYPITLKKTTAAEEDAHGSGWTFRGTWQYKEWGPKKIEEGQEGYNPEKEYDPETGYAYGFSAATATGISVGDFVRAGEGAWIRPMRAYLVKTNIPESTSPAQGVRANGAYVKRPSVVQEELPEIMSIVIDNGSDNDEQTTVIGHFNTRTGEIKMIPQQNRTFDVKGRNVGKANKARGAYYGKKSY